MTDKIIEAARAAGMTASIGQTTNDKYKPNVNALGRSVPVEWLARFYAIARAEALEDAAQVAEAQHEEDRPSGYAYAIRALKEQQHG